MLPFKLYRGDRAGNITKPELYRSNGLITKLINNGNSAYINNVGLYEAVRTHVKPESISEQVLHNSTSFLSFSSEKKIALKYASDGKSENLIQSLEYFERRYLFTIFIDDENIISLGKGLYKYDYNCNSNLISPDSPSQFEINLLRYRPCNYCNVSQIKHNLLLIDVFSFLKINPNFKKFHDAIENAYTDSEWLVLPVDFDIILYGYRGLIPRSNIWKADHYILKSEKFRDPELYAVKGVILDQN